MPTPEVVGRGTSVRQPNGEERLRELRRDVEYERLLGDDKMAEVLMYGANTREDRIAQVDALVEMQRKIFRRGKTAHVIVLSANVLTMAVMTSQLSMFRWKVTEAQTLTEATSTLQQQVLRARRGGFSVQRVAPAASKTASARAALFRKCSSVSTLAAEKRTGATSADKTRKAASTADGAATESAVGTEPVPSMKGSEHNTRPVSPPSSVCSAGSEDVAQKPPPDDMVAQLIIVDTFTHEPFTDIVDHLRYFDREDQLGLIIVLLLHDNYDNHSPGMVILPKHTTTVSEAYGLGYDLVLRRCFDHMVVRFFTEMFMSATGRWFNDMHAKGVVGNYRGMRHMLLEQDDVGLRTGTLSARDLDEVSNNGSEDMGLLKQLQSSYMSSALPSLNLTSRTQRLSSVGVRGDSASAPQSRRNQLHSIFNVKDKMSGIMTPSKTVKHATKRLCRRSTSSRDFLAGSNGNERENEEDAEKIYEDALVDERDEVETAVVAAYKEEVSRLLTELECSERTVALLREDVARMQESALSGGHFGGHSPHHSVSRDSDSPETYTSMSKEQQAIILRQRLMSVAEKLRVYEMQQRNDRERKRDVWSREKGRGISPNATFRFGMGSDGEDTPDIWSTNASTVQGMGVTETSALERTGNRTLNPTTSRSASPHTSDDDISNLCNEISSLLQGRKWTARESMLRGGNLQALQRAEEKNARMGVQMADAMEVIAQQKKRIAELEERLQEGKEEAKKAKGNKRRKQMDENSDNEDGNGGKPHRGSGGGYNAKKRRKKQDSLGAAGRVSAWVNDIPSCVSTRPPSTPRTPEKGEMRPMRGSGPMQHQGETGKRPHSQATQGQWRMTETPEQLKLPSIKPSHPQTQTHRPLGKEECMKAPVEAEDCMTRLKRLFNDIARTDVCDNEDALEKARAQARVVAREYAARLLEANGGNETPQGVEAALQKTLYGSVEKLRHAHMEAVKTAEDILNRGGDCEAYVRAVMNVLALEQQLRHVQQTDVGQAVTDTKGGARMPSGNATADGWSGIFDSHGNEGHMQKGPQAGGLNGARHGGALQTPAADGGHDSDVAAAHTNSLNALYVDHHQALMRFLQLVCMDHATLRPVLEHATDTLREDIGAEMRRQGGDAATRYLIAIDTALLSRLAALLGDAEKMSGVSSAPHVRRSTLTLSGSGGTAASWRGARGLRDSMTAEEVANLLNRRDITVDDIPPWLIELLEHGDERGNAALQEDPAAARRVQEVLAKVDAARKERGNELTELLRQRKRALMRSRAKGSGQSSRREASASDSGGDSDVSVNSRDETEALHACHSSLRRALSPSMYRCSVPPERRHAVLRRRVLTGQNVLYLEPNGDVTGEVSRRLLRLRRSDAEESDVEPGIFSVLPPVGLRGQPRRQQGQFQTMGGGPALVQLRDTPQDAAHAPGSVDHTAVRGAPRRAMAEVDRSPFSPEELADRIISYRPFLRHHGSDRLPVHMTAVYPTFAIPVAATHVPPALSSDTAWGTRRHWLPHQGALESYVSWVYGVPSEQLFPMLRGAAPEESDTVVFLPTCLNPDGGGTHTVHTPFVQRMLARADLFASPATSAARRINAQLQMSMADWQMGVIGRTITPATRGNQPQRFATQEEPPPAKGMK